MTENKQDKPRRTRKKKEKSISEQVEESANTPVEKRDPLDTSLLVPSGSTLLNCACSDNPFGAFVLGRIITLPGASAGGKTMQALTMMACCANDKRFDDYDLIYDDGEEALDMDIPYLFGNKLDQRLIAPAYDSEEYPLYSNTIQDFKALVFLSSGSSFAYSSNISSQTLHFPPKASLRQRKVSLFSPIPL